MQVTHNQLEGMPQLDAMRDGVAYQFRISLRKFNMRCRPLSISEQNSIATKVRADMTKVPLEERNALTENTALAKMTLETASTSYPGVYDPELSQEIMGHMTPDEVQFLYKQYIQVVERVNPSLDEIDRKELELLTEALKKTPPEQLASEVIGLTFLQLLNLCQHLIRGD